MLPNNYTSSLTSPLSNVTSMTTTPNLTSTPKKIKFADEYQISSPITITSAPKYQVTPDISSKSHKFPSLKIPPLSNPFTNKPNTSLKSNTSQPEIIPPLVTSTNGNTIPPHTSCPIQSNPHSSDSPIKSYSAISFPTV